MGRRIRVGAAVGAVLLLAVGAVPITRGIDGVAPHAIDLWDTTQCAPSTATEHTLFGMAGPVLQPGHADIRIIDAHPLGLSSGTRWRAWIVPVEPGSGWTGSLSTESPPAGWADRVRAAGATVSSGRPAELDLELWPAGRTRTSLRGFLVTYRTAFGIVRTVRTPTEITTRPEGCA